MSANHPARKRDDANNHPPANRSGFVHSGRDLMATGGSFAAAIVIQRWNESKRPWLQRRIGAFPYRQAREEMNVRAGALVAGTLTHLLMIGAMASLRRHQDRKAQLEDARRICRILTVAATAPDGAIPHEAGLIIDAAMISMGLGSKARKRALAEPRPTSINNLEAYQLHEPLLTAVATIAFSAMAEATSADDAARNMPTLMRRLGLARPTAEAKAAEIVEEYGTAYLLLSEHYAQLESSATEQSIQLHLPVSAMTTAADSVIARNPNEIARQATRHALATLVRQGIRATIGSGVRLNPATFKVVRMIGQLFGEDVAELPPRTAGALPPRSET